MLKVEAAVKDVFGPLSPREDVTMQRFSELTLEVRKRIEGATEADRQACRWLPYLLPPKDQEAFVLRESDVAPTDAASESVDDPSVGSSPLRRLLDETSDLIDSPAFSQVLTMLLDAGYSTLVDQKVAQQAYKVPVAPEVTELDTVSRITEIVDVKPVKLPILLAILTRQAHSIGNGVPNEYLQAMEQVRDLEAFAAVVYSSNWLSEINPDEGSVKSHAQKKEPSSPAIVIADITDSLVSGGDLPGMESMVDLGAASTFESAWGKAADTSSSEGKLAPE